MSAQRRDAEGRPRRPPAGEPFERQIREAMEGGAFDDLPYQGETLPLEDDSAAGEWAMAHACCANAGMAPPWIESDKEARRAAGRARGAHRTRTDGCHRFARQRAPGPRPIVAAANQAIARVNAEAPTVRQHRRPLDPVIETARLEEAFAGRGTAGRRSSVDR